MLILTLSSLGKLKFASSLSYLFFRRVLDLEISRSDYVLSFD